MFENSVRDTIVSPFYRMERLSNYLDVSVWVKRDDLIPIYMGGNKVRKNIEIISSHVLKHGVPDVIVSNGGSESNHARVLALIGSIYGIKVELVLHGHQDRSGFMHGNSYYLKTEQCSINYVDPVDISAKIRELVGFHLGKGAKVLVIPGGGHCLEAVNAYKNAFDEISFHPNYILHASGTGATQAGLIKGARESSSDVKILGISIARDACKGAAAIAELLPEELHDDIIIYEDYRFGGYGFYNSELKSFLSSFLQLDSLPLDPFYTGKAMFALFDLVGRGVIPRGSEVVFWHTGGLLNLQTSLA
ncbi:pyridoxal-phosphate dependent enzyme [Vreelandella rituensis]|uniref:Pyridoxal-phosphate dependent enzyme n=1 Tax=Vreelandella rituensis TaxID=2282306 RepID=A0A368TP71_9GAMM|nr:pyridoxal-phosphate dependent enzyme [Halomonas rituensis]RCV86062.1 pyridoxal-phosphate dependent enzyme [Halomonas rituensis]